MHTGPTGSLHIAPVDFGPDVERLLARCGLPTSDADAPQVRLYGWRRGNELVGVVGLEVYAPAGLLRSLAVDETARSSGVGRSLVSFAESQAQALYVERLYLLTTSAAEFFGRLGYEPASRVDAPPSIAATSQFTGLCPDSASFMLKALATRGRG